VPLKPLFSNITLLLVVRAEGPFLRTALESLASNRFDAALDEPERGIVVLLPD
jgi:hypothetical protein